MALPLLHIDEHLVAIHKPGGLPVHRSPLSHDRIFALQQLHDQLDRRTWPAHRIDRATSGMLLSALD